MQRLLERKEHFGTLTNGEVGEAARTCGVDRATIYRWLIAGRVVERERRTYSLTEDDKLAFFRARGDVANAHKLLKREVGEGTPSMSTYRRAIDREFDEGTKAAAKYGAAGRAQRRIALRDRIYRRNERWELDHSQLEVEVIGISIKTPARPWITWLIDAGTRYVGGWAISLNPTRGEVLCVIRQGVEDRPERGPFHGVPDVIVWDNGLEFTANAVSQCAQMLGAYATVAYPYSPERKPKIERINQSLERELLAMLPYYVRGPRKKDNSLYGPAEGRLSLRQLVDEVATWIEHYNFERPHSGIGNKTPHDAWTKDPTPLRTVPEDQLRRFTLERRLVTVSHDGGVTINRRSFTAPALNAHTRRKVEVGLMPHDYSRAEIFVDDKWLCTATPTTELTAEQVLDNKREIKRLDLESGKLIRRHNRLLRERYAPLTADERELRVLPPDPALKPNAPRRRDVLGFGAEIGTVEKAERGDD